jgi:copper chaperone CopZ
MLSSTHDVEGTKMTTRTYSVAGMTCGHCVAAVTAEVGKVPGVSDVSVDLAGKSVTVTGTDLDDVTVAVAVNEAGYAIVTTS